MRDTLDCLPNEHCVCLPWSLLPSISPFPVAPLHTRPAPLHPLPTLLQYLRCRELTEAALVEMGRIRDPRGSASINAAEQMMNYAIGRMAERVERCVGCVGGRQLLHACGARAVELMSCVVSPWRKKHAPNTATHAPSCSLLVLGCAGVARCCLQLPSLPSRS